MARWRALAEATLKGASFEKRLVTNTLDGLRVEPLYTPRGAAVAVAAAGAVGAAPFTRGVQRGSGWTIAQRIDLPDLAEANRQILTDLENGASGLVLVAGPDGLPLDTVDDAARLLDGVLLDLVCLSLDAGAAARRTTAVMVAGIERLGHSLRDIRFFPALDPIGSAARMGGRGLPAAATFAVWTSDVVHALTARGHTGPALLLDGRIVSDAGGTDAQELAFILASAVDLLRWLEGQGWAVEDVLPRMAAKVTVDADQFGSIAKIRALRTVWGRLTEALGTVPRLLDIRAETARRMLTRRDPWVNLLRSTVACFASAVGGAEEIALHPFTAALGIPDGFARRLARNTQSILMEETGLDRVADPAGGSAYVESLTQALAAAAWQRFQEIEAEGGICASLTAGAFQSRVSSARAERAAAIARRKIAITGVSEFPNVAEAPVPVWPAPTAQVSPKPTIRTWPSPGRGTWFGAQIAAITAGARSGDLVVPSDDSVSYPPLVPMRLADDFEALRDAADAALARTGQRETVFLAGLGAPAETITRATYAKNFMETGGFLAPANDGFPDVPSLVEGFRASGSRIACLCSTDEVYATQAEAAARALKAAGAETVLLAGQPGERREALTTAGVDLFIHVGIDVVAVLRDLQQRAGIAPVD